MGDTNYNLLSGNNEQRSSAPVYDDNFSVSCHASQRTPFPVLRNVWLTVLYLLLLTANEIMIVLDQEVYASLSNNFRYIVVQAGLLFFISLTYVIHRHDHRRARMGGYLSLYVKATRWIRAGLLIDGNAACLICVAAVNIDSTADGFEEAMILFVTIQNVILFWIYANHAVICFKHNRAQALPDALNENVLPRLSASFLPSGPNRSTQQELLKKQAHLIQGLEAQVKSLGEELVRAKGNSARGRSSQMNSELFQQKEVIRSLTIERDVLRRDLQKAKDEAEDLTRMEAMMMKENEESASLVVRQKKQMRVLQKEKSQLQILVEVHKETNANARKAIESLAAGTVAGLPSLSPGPTPL